MIANWSTVDWSMSTTALAKQLGVRVQTVSMARGRHAPETLR